MPDRLASYCFLLPIAGVLLGDKIAAGWLWDLANGFGFAAFAGLIYLSVQGKQRKLQLTHKYFSYTVTALLMAHVLMLLIMDTVVIEYLLPGAPLYMWAGTLALFLMFFIVLSALPNTRNLSFNGLDSFRAWHKPLSWLLIATATYHIIGSGLYIRTPAQWLAVILLLAPLLIPEKYNSRIGLRAYSPLSFLGMGVVASGLLSLALNWPTL
ncbi:MAG: hypothetical protein AB8B48_07375 [Pseudomonadales bacterium]